MRTLPALTVAGILVLGAAAPAAAEWPPPPPPKPLVAVSWSQVQLNYDPGATMCLNIGPANGAPATIVPCARSGSPNQQFVRNPIQVSPPND